VPVKHPRRDCLTSEKWQRSSRDLGRRLSQPQPRFLATRFSIEDCARFSPQSVSRARWWWVHKVWLDEFEGALDQCNNSALGLDFWERCCVPVLIIGLKNMTYCRLTSMAFEKAGDEGWFGVTYNGCTDLL
jgi:hypothetical protein